MSRKKMTITKYFRVSPGSNTNNIYNFVPNEENGRHIYENLYIPHIRRISMELSKVIMQAKYFLEC